MQNNLQDIIEGCLRKDRKAQHLLFNQFARWGFTICRRYVGIEEKAQEAMQDAFLRIFNKLHTFEPERGELKAWMARIFVNCALTTTKKEAFNNSFSALADLNSDPVAEEKFFSFDGEELLKFLKPMPTGYKTVFNMYVMDGYSHKEIGQHLNISEITSRSQLRKAKLWIKEHVSLDALKSRLES